jgi:hypothetical protein
MELRELPTAPFAAAGLIAGFGVAVGTGSRPLGGVVLLCFGLACVAISRTRDDVRTTAKLIAIAFGAFVASHALGLLIGAWPAVLVCAAGTALACDRMSDARWRLSRGRVAPRAEV